MRLIFWIIEFLATFSEMFLCIIFCGIFINNKKNSKDNKIILLLSLLYSLIVVSINHFTLYSPVQSMMSLFIMSGICCFIYSDN